MIGDAARVTLLCGLTLAGCSADEPGRDAASASNAASASAATSSRVATASRADPAASADPASSADPAASAEATARAAPPWDRARGEIDDAKYVLEHGFDRCATRCEMVLMHDGCNYVGVATEHAAAVNAEIRRHHAQHCFGPKVRGSASCVNGRCVLVTTTEGVPH